MSKLEFGYYPGCALHGSSNDYEQSVRAALDGLDVSLREISDWICCGATAAHSLSHMLSVALPARNLGIAEKEGVKELLAPCPMCSVMLLKSRQAVQKDKNLRDQVSEIVEAPVEGSTEVINLVQLFQKVGLDRLRAAVKKPLDDIRAACYYGCLLTRPPKTVKFDDPERPRSMEAVLEAVGAKSVEWNYATECCGAGLTMADEGTVVGLSNKILTDAAAHGANCIVVACPMCHVNLDMKQQDIERQKGVKHDLMIYYLSDLVGLAMGLPEKRMGIDRHFVVTPPRPVAAPEPAVAGRREVRNG